ncbi:MAG: hypothetical protein H6581_04465 [Bacteroidia bacterium]|nr:hypothetical protein [Bacteroidia bacterium]
MLSITNLPEVQSKLDQFLQHEAGSYKMAAWVALGLGLIFFFFLWFVALVFIGAAIYLFISQGKNKLRPAEIYVGTVKRKRRYENQDFSEQDGSKTVHHRLTLQVAHHEAYQVTAQDISPLAKDRGERELKVTQEMYENFRVGDEFIYLWSPAGDILGYVMQDEMIVLFGQRKVGNQMVNHSEAITQLAKPRLDYWAVVEEEN